MRSKLALVLALAAASVVAPRVASAQDASDAAKADRTVAVTVGSSNTGSATTRFQTTSVDAVDATSSSAKGLNGTSTSGQGVHGTSSTSAGVAGVSDSGRTIRISAIRSPWGELVPSATSRATRASSSGLPRS